MTIEGFNEETLRIAKYLESDLVYHQTEHIVDVWQSTGLPRTSLEGVLLKAVHDVISSNGGADIDLGQVRWDALAERYEELFCLETDHC